MLRPKDLGQDSGTKTFLDAMNSGKVHLARFVLDALDGRIINSKTENGKTPLMFAISLPDPGLRMKFTRLLLEKGADVNCQEGQGRTALSLACEMGHLDVVKLLVQFNADPEIQDAWGNSALMYAACSGHSQVLEFLIRAFKRLGLKLDRTNHAGRSAIQVANLFGHSQCVQALNIPGNKCPRSEDQLLDMKISEQSLEYHNDSQRAVVDSLNSDDSEVSDINERLARSGQHQKRFSLPYYGRPDKLLAQREEVSQENILRRPAGISALGTRLLRRLTAPEFLRLVKEFPSHSESGRGKMSRSETYPLSKTHQKVNNQASIDSISGVKCEFENNGANAVYYV
ncbi:UNVERIFIED_CONTAM: hypothetical protein FKN15_032259 [Acipenser sinensis]